MNCVIINTLRNRLNIRSESQGQGQIEGQPNKTKSYENQITVTLLVVTFSFLILTTPFYIIFIYLTSFGMPSSPRGFATFYLAYQIGEKSNYTNNAINFFLYVISGQKFRTDLAKLFPCNKDKPSDLPLSTIVTVSPPPMKESAKGLS